MGSDRPAPGSIRPGGRTARVRTAVLRVAADILAEHGFAHMDLTDIAARAGIGKTTAYRRWGTTSGLVADLLVDMAEQSLTRVETGSLRGDLDALTTLVARALTDPRQGALFTGVIAAANGDARVATALRGFYDTRLTEWSPCVVAAIERGELPAGTDPREVVAAACAPLYYRLLASGDPIDDRAIRTAAHAAELAAKAGAFICAD